MDIQIKLQVFQNLTLSQIKGVAKYIVKIINQGKPYHFPLGLGCHFPTKMGAQLLYAATVTRAYERKII